MADKEEVPTQERLMHAVGEAMRSSSITLSGLLRSLQVVIKKNNNLEGDAVLPIILDSGEFRGLQVFPSYLNLSAHDQGVAIRRAIAYGYIAPVAVFARRLVESGAVEAGGRELVKTLLEQLVEFAVRDLASTFEDLVDMVENTPPEEDFTIIAPTAIQAEA